MFEPILLRQTNVFITDGCLIGWCLDPTGMNSGSIDISKTGYNSKRKKGAEVTQLVNKNGAI
jgi:hypothetical protein